MTEKITITLITLGGSAAGFIFGRLFDFFSDRLSSKSALLEKLQKHTLSQHGKLRLKNDLVDSIHKLQDSFQRGALPDESLVSIKSSDRFFKKLITQPINESNCPVDTLDSFYLFYDTEKISQSIVYDLKLLAEALNVLLENFFKEANSIDSLMINSKSLIDNSVQLTFWVQAANFFPRDNDSLNENYNLIAATVNKWISGCQVILQLYLPEDVSKTVEGLLIKPSLAHSELVTPLDNKFTSLVQLRNDLNRYFANGWVFGELSYVHDPIPENVIGLRLNEITGLDRRDILNIYGSPGSGKTYLLKCLLENYQKSYKGLFLIINNVHLVNAFIERAVIKQDRAKFYESVVDIVTDGTFNLLPNESTGSAEAMMISKFILSSILTQNRQSLYLVIDDYYLYKETIERFLTNILDKNWNVKLIIAGRPESIDLNEKYNTRSARYECKSWDRSDALQIINSWTSRTETEVENALNIEWLKNENKFSIYLLRLINNNIGVIDTSALSDILLKELINSLKPVYQQLIGPNNQKKISYNELVKALEELAGQENLTDIKPQLKELISRKTTIDIDTFINRMGELSWASRFQFSGTGGSLSNELIQQHFPFLDIDTFSTLGSAANIFKANRGKGSLDWNDSLIADGCLSLLLRRNLQKIINDPSKYREFSGQLEGLRNQNSLNILNLVLDNDAIIQLAKVIGHTNFTRIDLIDELLTEQKIQKLKTEDKIAQLASVLIESFRVNRDNTFIVKIARFVKKLSDADVRYKAYLNSMLGVDPFISEVAAYVLALDLNGDDQYYKRLDQLDFDSYESTKISILLWGELKSEQLLYRLSHLYDKGVLDMTKILELWSSYLKQYDLYQAVNMSIDILANDLFVENHLNIELLRTLLIFIKDNRHSAQVSEAVKKLKYLLKETWDKKHFSFSNQLVKVIVWIESPKLVFKDTDWVVHKLEHFAMPVNAYGPHMITEIAAYIPTTKGYNIPRQKNLLDQNQYTESINKSQGWELVADNFGEPYLHRQNMPVNYKVVNLSVNPISSQTATKEDIRFGDRKFFWRPIYEFA